MLKFFELNGPTRALPARIIVQVDHLTHSKCGTGLDFQKPALHQPIAISTWY